MWSARTGWVVVAEPGRMELIQIGPRCYRRWPPEAWREFTANDPGGLCNSALLENPASAFEFYDSLGGVNRVGTSRVNGVATTHYRMQLNIGAVKGPFELLGRQGRHSATISTAGRVGEGRRRRTRLPCLRRRSARPPAARQAHKAQRATQGRWLRLEGLRSCCDQSSARCRCHARRHRLPDRRERRWTRGGIGQEEPDGEVRHRVGDVSRLAYL